MTSATSASISSGSATFHCPRISSVPMKSQTASAINLFGTTVVRTLEDAARRAAESSSSNLVQAGKAEAQLFIVPGFRFRVVDGLLTNFHLPRSTLLALVCAFAGRERVLAAYRHAVEESYRFYSYGDCMLIR